MSTGRGLTSIAPSRALAKPLSPRLQNDVERLRRRLPSPVPHTAKPYLIVVSGLPGTGKTHFSRHLAERIPLVVLNSDAMRKTLVVNPTYTPAESGRVFTAAHALLNELLTSGVPVLFDATNLVESSRRHLYRLSRDSGANIALIHMHASDVVVRRRLQVRQRGRETGDNSDADWEVYLKLRETKEPIRRPHLVLDTSNEAISTSVERALKWLSGEIDLEASQSTSPMQ